MGADGETVNLNVSRNPLKIGIDKNNSLVVVTPFRCSKMLDAAALMLWCGLADLERILIRVAAKEGGPARLAHRVTNAWTRQTGFVCIWLTFIKCQGWI